MICRASHAGLNRHRRPTHPSVKHRPETGAERTHAMTLRWATEVVADVAAVLPPPEGVLQADESARHAFEALLTEAASVVAIAVRHNSRLLSEARFRPLVLCDPVRRQLVDLALALADQRNNA